MLVDVLTAAQFGYTCQPVQSFEDSMNLLKTKSFDIFLVDKEYPEEGLYRKLKKIKVKCPSLRILLLADEVSPKELMMAQEHFIEGFCPLRDDYTTLINTIEGVIS